MKTLSLIACLFITVLLAACVTKAPAPTDNSQDGPSLTAQYMYLTGIAVVPGMFTDYLVMIGFAVVLVAFLRSGIIPRPAGVGLAIAYAVYLGYTLLF